jgi:hypothetical protein
MSNVASMKGRSVMSGKWTQQAKKKGSGGGGDDRPLPPAGEDQSAVLVALVDLGTHLNTYGGQETWKRKVFLVWELVEVPGRLLAHKDFTLSLHEAALLRQFVDSWKSVPLQDDEDFDVSKLVGQPCLLDIIHKKSKDGSKTFHDVKAAKKPIFRGQKVKIAAPEHKPFCWHLDDGGEGKLPDWLPWLYGRSITEWIQDSKERRGDESEREPGEEGDEGEAPQESEAEFIF